MSKPKWERIEPGWWHLEGVGRVMRTSHNGLWWLWPTEEPSLGSFTTLSEAKSAAEAWAKKKEQGA